jgi:hypothetical protein
MFSNRTVDKNFYGNKFQVMFKGRQEAILVPNGLKLMTSGLNAILIQIIHYPSEPGDMGR